eukprot:CAMPEP_0168539238 /NCGR_PEP_ID=MMETSP0405-20121227/21704_1 /TAXON_ID=498012 /ORGANISM="Trichosphaerium sp, Strain Am-I-7 wt" /LENGTH=224 /DNA_ID=CAMNT_0008568753 /DNA_START=130 /DNA_END=801 /DNA_ORIENTATION=-
MAAKSLDAGPVHNEMSLQTAVAEKAMTSVAFKVQRLVTIKTQPRDLSKEVQLPIDVSEFDAEFSWSCVPSLVEKAYLQATVKNTKEGLHLLEGSCSVFLDNNFVTRCDIPKVVSGESFDLALGVDESIKVTHVPEREMATTSGVISKKNIKTIEQVIKIENHKLTPITISVLMQVPKSSSGNLKIMSVNPKKEDVIDMQEKDIAEDAKNLSPGYYLQRNGNLRW